MTPSHHHTLIHLHHNQQGFVGYCNGCQRIHLAYGVVMLAMGYQEFLNWQQRIHIEIENFDNGICPYAKHFVFQTESEDLRLILNWKELNDMQGLIAPAILLLDVHVMLGYYKQ